MTAGQQMTVCIQTTAHAPSNVACVIPNVMSMTLLAGHVGYDVSAYLFGTSGGMKQYIGGQLSQLTTNYQIMKIRS